MEQIYSSLVTRHSLKILYLTARLPFPLEKGDKLRAYYQLRELAAQGHEVVVCALHEGTAPKAEDVARVEALGVRVHVFALSKWNFLWQIPAWLFRKQPIQVGYFYSSKISRQIAEIAQREAVDVVWAQMLRVLPYAQQAGNADRVVLDLMDCLSANTRRWAEQAATWWQRPLLRREARLLAAWEQRAVQAYPHCCIISEQDRELLPMPHEQVQILPNGVDLQFFAPAEQTTTPAYELVFVGNMGYRPNVEAAKILAQQILPLVHKRLPNVRLLLAGARPSDEVKALASEQVDISGWVDDIRTAYRAARLLVAPLFIGSGQQNKILEAMALGTPCLTTTLVNNAIGAQVDKQIFIADSAEAFAEQICQLLQQPARLAEVAHEAAKFVRERYDWRSVMQQVDLPKINP